MFDVKTVHECLVTEFNALSFIEYHQMPEAAVFVNDECVEHMRSDYPMDTKLNITKNVKGVVEYLSNSIQEVQEALKSFGIHGNCVAHILDLRVIPSQVSEEFEHLKEPPYILLSFAIAPEQAQIELRKIFKSFPTSGGEVLAGSDGSVELRRKTGVAYSRFNLFEVFEEHVSGNIQVETFDSIAAVYSARSKAPDLVTEHFKSIRALLPEDDSLPSD